jgi:transposase
MEELPTYEIKNIGHLGIIAAIFKEYKMVERINSLLPKISNNQNVTHGEVILSMIMQGLGFSNLRLYLSAEFFSHVAMQGIYGKDKETKRKIRFGHMLAITFRRDEKKIKRSEMRKGKVCSGHRLPQ